MKTQVLRVLRWACKIGPGWAQLGLGQPLKKPNLSPSCAILDNWAQVGANGSGNPLDGPQIEAMWCTWGPSQVQSGGAWNFLATASHQVGQRRHHAWKRMFWRFRIGPAVSNVPVLSIWSSTWVDIAPECVRVRAKLRHVGPELGRGLNQMGPSGAEVGACCGHVEPKLWHICPFVSLAARLPRPGTFGVGGFRDWLFKCLFVQVRFLLFWFVADWHETGEQLDVGVSVLSILSTCWPHTKNREALGSLCWVSLLQVSSTLGRTQSHFCDPEGSLPDWTGSKLGVAYGTGGSLPFPTFSLV